MASPPSATAVSIAATRSPVKPDAVDASCVDQRALYIATRARGAMPLIVPNTAAGPVPVDDRVAAQRAARPGRVEVLRPDELLVAVGLEEALAVHAPAVPAGDLLERQLAVLGGIAVEARPVGEAERLRPDARIDDADDDVLAG